MWLKLRKRSVSPFGRGININVPVCYFSYLFSYILCSAVYRRLWNLADMLHCASTQYQTHSVCVCVKSPLKLPLYQTPMFLWSPGSYARGFAKPLGASQSTQATGFVKQPQARGLKKHLSRGLLKQQRKGLREAPLHRATNILPEAFTLVVMITSCTSQTFYYMLCLVILFKVWALDISWQVLPCYFITHHAFLFYYRLDLVILLPAAPGYFIKVVSGYYIIGRALGILLQILPCYFITDWKFIVLWGYGFTILLQAVSQENDI